MEYKMNFNEVKNAYMNRAGSLMESFFSDLYHDVKMIEKMTEGSVYYFIVQPNCTHLAEEEIYDVLRDSCARCWGNYAVFRIETTDESHYIIKNWDILEKSSYDTQSAELIQKYKNFGLGLFYSI